MRNHLKMTLLLAVVLVAFTSTVQAGDYYAPQYYTYTQAYTGSAEVSNTFSYDESDDGFTIHQQSKVPRREYRTYNPRCDFVDWTSNGRKLAACRKTSYYNDRTVDYYSYYDDDEHFYDNFRAPYDQDKAIKEGFKTYQQTSKQKYQLESQRLNLRYQRRYGGYGYGYSGYSRYSWGW